MRWGWTGLAGLVWLLLWAVSGAQAGFAASFGAVAFDAPPGWIRLDDDRAASFSPPGYSNVVVSVFAGQGGDVRRTLDRFVSTAESQETSLSRQNAEALPGTHLIRSLSRSASGAEVSRLYAGVSIAGASAIVAMFGSAVEIRRFEADFLAFLSTLRPADSTPGQSAAVALAGDGGLDGAYLSLSERNSLAAATAVWTDMRRSEVLVFDPLGQVYRGGAERAGVALFEACANRPSWRCGRYRIEGDHILLRWNDGSVERRGLSILESSLLMDGVAYHLSAVPEAGDLAGLYAFANFFNAGDWPQGAGRDGSGPLTIRFLEGGRFTLSGFTQFRNPQFGKDISVSGRYRIAGGEITLVYRTGTADVLSLLAFDDNGQRGLMIGGRAFNLSDQ